MTTPECKFIKKAHAAIICGATDCGKTEFTLNLLETEYKQFFKYIIIICPTWRYNQILIMFILLIQKNLSPSQKIH